MPSAFTGPLAIDFSAQGNSAIFRGEGWSGQESDRVWSVGPQSTLRLPRGRLHEAMVLEMDVLPCLAPPLFTGQTLTVHVNGTRLGTFILRERCWIACEIPATLFTLSSHIDVRLDHPQFLRPDLLAASAETRALGISVFTARLVPATQHVAASRNFVRFTRPARRPTETPQGRPGKPVIYDLSDPHVADQVAGGPDWYRDELNLNWTSSPTTVLSVPVPAGPGEHLLRLRLAPLTIRRMRPTQRISIAIEGMCAGQFRLSTQTVLAVPLPVLPEPRPSHLTISLIMPDLLPLARFRRRPTDLKIGFLVDEVAIVPVPPRLAAISAVRDDMAAQHPPMAVSRRFQDVPDLELRAAIEAVCGTPIANILRDFESLGDNCGFGLAQRKGGVEVLGLLRFATTPLTSLVRGLDDEFQAAANRTELALELGKDVPREYRVVLPRYDIRWHSFVHEGEEEPDVVFQQQSMKIGYNRRRFQEGLRAGRKIYVLTRSRPLQRLVVHPRNQHVQGEMPPAPLTLAEAMPIANAINHYAGNTLLFVVPSEGKMRSGTVEMLAPGILRGHIASLSISNNVTIADEAEWLRVVANAWLLDTGPNQSLRARPAPEATAASPSLISTTAKPEPAGTAG